MMEPVSAQIRSRPEAIIKSIQTNGVTHWFDGGSHQMFRCDLTFRRDTEEDDDQ